MSTKFPPAIPGPEMDAPILWAPGIFGLFLLENPHAHKIPPLGGVLFFFEGGWKCQFYFYGRGDFFRHSQLSLWYFVAKKVVSEFSGRVRIRISIRSRIACNRGVLRYEARPSYETKTSASQKMDLFKKGPPEVLTVTGLGGTDFEEVLGRELLFFEGSGGPAGEWRGGWRGDL